MKLLDAARSQFAAWFIVELGFQDLYGREFELFAGLCLGFGLFAGLERKRLGKLNGDASYEAVDVIDPTDMAGADETGHIEGVIGSEAGHAETGGYVLALVWTGIVGVTGECRAGA